MHHRSAASALGETDGARVVSDVPEVRPIGLELRPRREKGVEVAQLGGELAARRARILHRRDPRRVGKRRPDVRRVSRRARSWWPRRGTVIVVDVTRSGTVTVIVTAARARPGRDRRGRGDAARREDGSRERKCDPAADDANGNPRLGWRRLLSWERVGPWRVSGSHIFTTGRSNVVPAAGRRHAARIEPHPAGDLKTARARSSQRTVICRSGRRASRSVP